MTWPHLGFVVVGAGCVAEGGEAVDLLPRQFDAVGGEVLLKAADPPGVGDRVDVASLGRQPRERDLRRAGAYLAGDRLDLLDEARAVGEVLF